MKVKVVTRQTRLYHGLQTVDKEFRVILVLGRLHTNQRFTIKITATMGYRLLLVPVKIKMQDFTLYTSTINLDQRRAYKYHTLVNGPANLHSPPNPMPVRNDTKT